MSSIDIRHIDDDDVITEIIFGNKVTSDDNPATAHKLLLTDFEYHRNIIFIENLDSMDFVAIRRSDVGNLIKALEKAKEIWEGVK